MYVFLLSADCLYTAPVDHERGCLPSPEELKGKILVKVRMHVILALCTYIRTYCTCIRTFIHVSYYVFILYIHTYVCIFCQS